MKRYNIRDIVATEELYLKLRPWDDQHPNLAVYSDAKSVTCNRCGSVNLHKRGYAYTNVGQYHRYQCGDCGGWQRGRFTLNSLATRKNLTA
jgi:transposase-like protein